MKCLLPGCANEQSTRGMCRQCYSSFNHLIKIGIYTWDELKDKGWSYAPKPLGRPKKKKMLTDDEVKAILVERFPDLKVQNRQQLIDAIGGDLSVVSEFMKTEFMRVKE
jgi:hypothetical protein